MFLVNGFGKKFLKYINVDGFVHCQFWQYLRTVKITEK